MDRWREINVEVWRLFFVDVRCWWCFGWSVLLVFPTVRLVEEVGVAVSASRLWIAVLNVVAVAVVGGSWFEQKIKSTELFFTK